MAMEKRGDAADTWEIQTFGAASEGQRRQLRRYEYRGWPIPWEYLTTHQAAILLRRYEQGKPLWNVEDEDPGGIRPEPKQRRLL
jgi:hypothetical protein